MLLKNKAVLKCLQKTKNIPKRFKTSQNVPKSVKKVLKSVKKYIILYLEIVICVFVFDKIISLYVLQYIKR